MYDREAIRGYVTGKIIDESPHSWPKSFNYNKSHIILYIFPCTVNIVGACFVFLIAFVLLFRGVSSQSGGGCPMIGPTA